MTQTDVLTAIEEALAAGMPTEADPVTRELQELGLLLRADAPEPAAAYSESLARRVERGFPRRTGSKRPWWHQALQPAAGLALVAMVVGLIALGGNGLSGSSGDDSGGSSSGAEDAGGGSGGGSAAQPALSGADTSASSGRGFAPGRSDRRIERSFALELETPEDQIGRVADQVTAVTNRHGGFVVSSSVATGEDGSGGDFDLRIPATEVRPALRALAALGDVRSQSQTG